MTTITSITVTYNGIPLSTRTINARMEAADPGHWGLDHPLAYSCPIMAQHAISNIQDTFGPRYNVAGTTLTRQQWHPSQLPHPEVQA